MGALRALCWLLAVPALFLLVGCENREISSRPLEVKTAPAATAAPPDPNACKEHTGKSRHGDDCKETLEDGYCMTHGLSFAEDGSDAVCTSGDMSGCTLTNQEACPCSCADHIDNHATYHCTGDDYDHAGSSKYGTNCNETRDGGHCGSMRLSWTAHDAPESETCTFNDQAGCKLTNAQACCMACAPIQHGCEGSLEDHPGMNRYGDTCAAAKAGGHCKSHQYSWAEDGTDAVCTSADMSGCALTNEMACCYSCVHLGPDTHVP